MHNKSVHKKIVHNKAVHNNSVSKLGIPVERAQERTKAPFSKSKREQELFPGILIPGDTSDSFFMSTASFCGRHSHQRISFSRSILLKMNFSCRDIEIVVKKTYVRWRAHSGLRLFEAGGRRAPGDRWLKYNFQKFSFVIGLPMIVWLIQTFVSL